MAKLDLEMNMRFTIHDTMTRTSTIDRSNILNYNTNSLVLIFFPLMIQYLMKEKPGN